MGVKPEPESEPVIPGQSLSVRPIPNSSSPLRGEDRGGGEINAMTRNPAFKSD